MPYTNKLIDPNNASYDAFSQGSYAGMVGTVDIFRWWCGCPVYTIDNIVCFGQVELKPDGMFGNNHNFRETSVPDGLSQTLLVGEFSRFRNDPDPVFNEWNGALYYYSNWPGSLDRRRCATSVPKINANLMVPDYPPSTTLGPVNWKIDPVNQNFGQFGFRSQHPSGPSSSSPMVPCVSSRKPSPSTLTRP